MINDNRYSLDFHLMTDVLDNCILIALTLWLIKNNSKQYNFLYFIHEK